MTPAGTRIIGYTRSSTEDQKLTHEAQEAIIRRMAGQRDWYVVDVLHDKGVSGAAAERPARDKAIQRIERGEADALVVSKLDRLSRSIVDFGELAERARKNKWALVVLDPEVDMTTAAGEMMAGVLVVFAQFERRMISDRTKAGLEAAKAKGVQVGRTSGLTQETLNRIHRAYAAGKSYNSIATELNNDKVPTSQGGKAWYASTIKKIITGAN